MVGSDVDGGRKYTLRIVEGALRDVSALARFSPKTIELFEDDPEWKALLEITATRSDLEDIQENMTRHYRDSIPWYLDGFEAENRNSIICAFGADDGEGGKVFLFDRDDEAAFREVVAYAISKGIPREQMDFLGNL